MSFIDELIGWKRLFIDAVEQRFRNRLNLVAGTGVAITAADVSTPGSERTDVTIAIDGDAGHEIQDNGTPMPTQDALNFIGFTVQDSTGSTDVILPGGVETTDGFTMPAIGANVEIDLVTTAGLVAGQVLFIEDAGHIEVISVDGLTTITGQNIGDARNAAEGVVIGSGRRIQNSGPAGPSGADGADGETGPTGPSGPLRVSYLTSGTSLVLLSGTTKIDVEVWGAGGGGAGAAGIVA